MCGLCSKYGYNVQGRVLVKRAKYKTNHLYVKKAWSFSQALIDNHIDDVDLIRVIETDLGRTWEVSVSKFTECKETRTDTEKEPQYMLRDAHWTVRDPNEVSPKKQAQPVLEQQLTLAI